MKNSLNIKWFEYLFISVFVLATIIIGIIFQSSLLIISYSVVGIISIFLLTKGLFVGNVLQVIAAIVYAIISFKNQYYGEMITCLFITIPVYCASIFTWLKNKDKASSVVKVNKLKLKEYLIVLLASVVIYVLLYFMLKAFNTANLIFSTLSMTIGVVASYLVLRRSEFNFVCYLTNNIVCIILWCTVSLTDAAYFPTMVNYVVFLLLNISGVINWIKLKKEQNKK